VSAVVWAKDDAWAPYADGRKAPIGSLAIAELSDRMARYRREVAKRYRVVSHELISKFLPEGSFTISTKLDGELWFLVKRGEEVVLASYNGRMLHGTSLVREAAAKLKGSADLLVAGELVAIPEEGRPRVQHVAAALGAGPLEHTLRFFPFDLVEEGSVDSHASPYKERHAKLTRLFGEAKDDARVAPVTSVEGDSAAVTSYFRAWVQTQLFEGLVVRAESGITFKIKPTFTIDAVVVAYGDRRTVGAAGSAPLTEMRELTLALLNDDGSLQIIGPVGGGFDLEQRVAWRERLSKLEAPSSFRMANREGTLCRFVRPEVVVEVKCSDLIETDTNDAPIARMALRWDAKTGYSPVGDTRVPALLFPVFLRERTDKRVDLGSVGLEQLTSRLPVDMAAWDRRSRALPDAVVVRRGVWTKAGGAVRKYVIIETKKSRADGYAPFVVYFTDFATGRAEPLKTSVRVASTLASAEAHAAAWQTENVKRGWAPPTASGEGATEAAPAEEATKPKKPAARRAKASTDDGG
jgi:hypothetical protein